MIPTISLVVPVRDAGRDLVRFVTTLDRQSADPQSWEVVFVDGGSRDATGDRLAVLARFRPNVTVVSAGRDQSWRELVAAGVEATSGSWVLVSELAGLTRAAISRWLHSVAEDGPFAGQVDVVVGRSVDATRSVVDERVFAEGAEAADSLDVIGALMSPALLIRRDLLVEPEVELSGDLPAAQWAVTVARSARVRLLGPYPAQVGRGLRRRLSDHDRIADVLAAVDLATTVPDAESAASAPQLERGLGRVLARTIGAAPARAADAPEPERIAAAAARLVDHVEPGADRCLLRLLADGRLDLAEELAAAMAAVELTPAPATVGIVDGVVHVEATARLVLPTSLLDRLADTAIGAADLIAGLQPRVALRNRQTTGIYVAATQQTPQVTVDTDGADGAVVTLSVSSDLDVLTMDEGRRLPGAAYQVVFEVIGAGWAGVLQQPLTGGTDLSALVSGVMLSVRDIAANGLHLDVSTTRRSLLGPIAPDGATVVEDARGSLMTMPVPELVVVGDNPPVINGAVLLGGLPFPAQLIVGDEPRVECWVSGLPGVVEIRTKFGGSAASPTGCELVTTMDGHYQVRPLTEASTSGVSTTVATGVSPRDRILAARALAAAKKEKAAAPPPPPVEPPAPPAPPPAPPAPAAPKAPPRRRSVPSTVAHSVWNVAKRNPVLHRAGRRVLSTLRRR